ncbi:hypothetical protein GCM10010347_14670 [Streptomyces cirratus]|uniref:Uncharacterized protein n=1 Tax=Streptomyces cirratus TaxID=68187 RepID=A0ABQ3EUS0_9ACTN|nr:hypothetical protein GCM10010347_14670 [Streptomyces cirratus]
MATPDVDRSHGPDVVSSFDEPLPGVRAMVEPGTELLDRALAGWQRFLTTFEGASGE